MTFCVGLEATKRCNFSCEHCFVDAGRPRAAEMDAAAMKSLLRDLARCGVTTIAWSGGEPLLRADLEEISRAGFAHGLEFTLATNGYLADRKRLESLIKCGLKVIQIGLDGPTPFRATKIRKGPSDAFQRAVQAAVDAVSIGLTVHLCCLFTPATASEFEEMVAFARSLGVHGLRYAMWMPVGRAAGISYDEQNWPSSEVGHFFRQLPQAQQPDFCVLVDCPMGPCPGRESFQCKAGRETAYITSDGDVYPCTALMTSAYRVGNIKQASVEELLFSEDILHIRRELAGHTPSGLCTACKIRKSCHGGCPGRTVAAFGKFIGGKHGGAPPMCLYRSHGAGDFPVSQETIPVIRQDFR